MNELVPVTILGGYLGAGKTTLLNAILAGDHGRRLAVLVNDFGAINIDTDLVASHDGNTISLQNGCICCSIADSLGEALDEALSADSQTEQIVIEASGVAEPAKLAAYGQGWPGCRLDAVVVLADAETVRARAVDEFVGDLVIRQLAAADVVVLTKGDLVSPAEEDAVADWIADELGDRTSSHPVVLRSHRGDLDPALLLDPPVDATALGGPLGRGVGAVGLPGPDAGDRFVSAVVAFEDPVPRERLTRELDAWPAEVVRVKGVIDVDEPGAASTVHRVGRRWTIEPWGGSSPVPERRLVAIGVAAHGGPDLADLLGRLTL